MFFNSHSIPILALAMTTMAAWGAAAPTANGTYTPIPLTYFGERASWSPNGTKIAFMSKSYGDAFEIDLATRQIKLVTQFPNAGLLRVQYLPNNDYFLIGARNFTDITTTRERDEEMWVFTQNGTDPIALNQKINEGVAISRKTNTIAWANNHLNYPDTIAENETAMYIADIVYTDGVPALANKRELLRAQEPECQLEPQDFHNNDTELTYTCYHTGGSVLGADVRSLNLATGESVIYRDVTDEYNECEGIYPDGQYTLVESGKDQIVPDGDRAIDIWRLRTEPNSTDFIRLTTFGDTVGRKASNPVVSPDGRTVAFQEGRSTSAAGVGYGLYLLDL